MSKYLVETHVWLKTVVLCVRDDWQLCLMQLINYILATNLHNEKNQIWKFYVNRIVSVTVTIFWYHITHGLPLKKLIRLLTCIY